jgi:hypothetical protein
MLRRRGCSDERLSAPVRFGHAARQAPATHCYPGASAARDRTRQCQLSLSGRNVCRKGESAASANTAALSVESSARRTEASSAPPLRRHCAQARGDVAAVEAIASIVDCRADCEDTRGLGARCCLTPEAVASAPRLL